MMKTDTKKAFTLLEVLVAMSVLAIGMLTLVKVSTQNTIQTGYLKDKTLAHWVAVNKMNEVKLESSWPDKGKSNGTITMANRDWYWKLKVTDYGKQSEKVRILKIDIRLEERNEDALVSYFSFANN